MTARVSSSSCSSALPSRPPHSAPCLLTLLPVPSLCSLSPHSAPCLLTLLPVSSSLLPVSSLCSLSPHSAPCLLTLLPVSSLCSLSPPLCSLSPHSAPCLLTLLPVSSLCSLSPPLCSLSPHSAPCLLTLLPVSSLCSLSPHSAPCLLTLLPVSSLCSLSPHSAPSRVCDKELLRCQNGGLCQDHQRCQCAGGYSGVLCEKHRCEAELGPGCDGGTGVDSGQAPPPSAPRPLLVLVMTTVMMSASWPFFLQGEGEAARRGPFVASA
ncbi:unnamed protein product [Arctogadus glacialis]